MLWLQITIIDSSVGFCNVPSGLFSRDPTLTAPCTKILSNSNCTSALAQFYDQNAACGFSSGIHRICMSEPLYVRFLVLNGRCEVYVDFEGSLLLAYWFHTSLLVAAFYELMYLIRLHSISPSSRLCISLVLFFPLTFFFHS